MPINRVLKTGKYTPEEIEILNKAFDLALRSMGLVDRNDPLCEMVARKVIEAGATGMSEPKEIADTAVARIGLR
ncbi:MULTISPECIES: hypothetical protein [unclassified Bradyrhizobium]|uniref:hypothetical protein n=1 Tax=unclassified Bradyrhizobium TaxID=2631580 RepID=UPI00247B0E0D|nr:MULTISPECIES: hypothetical protein [unclassified Bradyrhizobium]WGS22472.1 hypothetical protein MTX22_12875 [Bradyrhizobium sp. ISRA463]WGS29447.1 hypothetical protein MTX19_10645 [Bradyrhizobium sp. ISRA464]